MVNRAGNALRELGVEAEQRVLCLLSTRRLPGTFWGHQDRRNPIPTTP